MPEQESSKAFMIGQFPDDGLQESPQDISPHEQIHEPLNPPGEALSRIEQPCDGKLNFEIRHQATVFFCERRLDHTGKHTAHYDILAQRDKSNKTSNKSDGVEVTLSW